MEKNINFCIDAANISTEYEKANTDLKRRYLISYIKLYNYIAYKADHTCATFGTGYPFYALGKNLEGNLPIINEQIRYNNDLIGHVINSEYEKWNCAECLSKCGKYMEDLKGICKPCPNMDNELKPRKIINRLPDMDLWIVSESKDNKELQETLIKLYKENNIQPSDLNPLNTIKDIEEITRDLKNGKMPSKFIPLDAHIIDKKTLYELIEKTPYELKKSIENKTIPFLPIHPLSYRKKWQYDDTAYNFVHDYLSSLTEFNFNGDLKNILMETRKYIAETYSMEQLYNILLASGPESVKRRHKTLELKNCFEERINSWKK